MLTNLSKLEIKASSTRTRRTSGIRAGEAPHRDRIQGQRPGPTLWIGSKTLQEPTFMPKVADRA